MSKLSCFPFDKLSRVVALLTDFGERDHYVGVVKGRILQDVKGEYPHLIDITHSIPPQDVKKASLYLKFSYPYFPPGTIFLAVVDPGVGTERKALLLISEDLFFIGPDNGIFTFILKNPYVDTYEILTSKILKPPFSSTFHARDLFAIAVAMLLNQEPLEKWTKPISKDTLRKLSFPEPELLPDGYKLSPWYVDHFGNIITNLSQRDAPKSFEIWVNGKKVKLVNTYAEGKEGEVIALFGSEGLLEIAIKNDSAFKKLGYPEIVIKLKGL